MPKISDKTDKFLLCYSNFLGSIFIPTQLQLLIVQLRLPSPSIKSHPTFFIDVPAPTLSRKHPYACCCCCCCDGILVSSLPSMSACQSPIMHSDLLQFVA